MDKKILTQRTRQFAVRVFKFIDRIPRTNSTHVIINQLPRAAGSVAANYRAVNRAKSTADFGNKLKIVLEEVDECNFWLGFLFDIGQVKQDDPEYNFLVKESDELVAIFAAASKTTAMKAKLASSTTAQVTTGLTKSKIKNHKS